MLPLFFAESRDSRSVVSGCGGSLMLGGWGAPSTGCSAHTAAAAVQDELFVLNAEN